jgi:hypothetical protein
VSAHGQKARIYKTQVAEDPARVTAAGGAIHVSQSLGVHAEKQRKRSLIDDIRRGSKRKSASGAVWLR